MQPTADSGAAAHTEVVSRVMRQQLPPVTSTTHTLDPSRLDADWRGINTATAMSVPPLLQLRLLRCPSGQCHLLVQVPDNLML